MESHAKLFGHPGHPILVVFPLGLLGTSALFDLIYWFNESQGLATASFYMQVAGIVGGLIAAPFGWIDWFAIPAGTRAKRIGLLHGTGNLVVLLLFAVSALLRWDEITTPPTLSLICSVAGFALAGLTGWLGGELVDRLGVGVDHGAHLNAPNSLSNRPISEGRAL
jgi:uncharacterized membrane protein